MSGNQAIASAPSRPGSTTSPATRSRRRRTSSSGCRRKLPHGRRHHDPVRGRDRLASASVLGASYAGAKAMTATSGPGLSLMTEVLGFAGTAEIPCVIIDAQRGGPSTGLPTKTEQSDLQHALYGGHGEAPRVVIAPISVEDCFWSTIDAFNYRRALPGAGDPPDRPGPGHPDGGHPQARHGQGRAVGRARPRRGVDGDYKRYALHRGLRLADGHPRRGGRPVRRRPASSTTSSATRATRPRSTWHADQALGEARAARQRRSPATRSRRRAPRDRADRLRLHLRAGARGGRPGPRGGPVGGRLLPARARALPGRAGQGVHVQRHAACWCPRSTSPGSSPA